MRRDVGATTLLLLSEAETAHVELISHIRMIVFAGSKSSSCEVGIKSSFVGGQTLVRSSRSDLSKRTCVLGREVRVSGTEKMYLGAFEMPLRSRKDSNNEESG